MSPAFSSFAAFLNMGGDALYVWLAAVSYTHLQADAVDRDAVSDFYIFQNLAAADLYRCGNAAFSNGSDRSYFFDDACKHGFTSLSMSISSPKYLIWRFSKVTA